MGILGILGVLFIALKLIGFIAWSWFWVLSPFLIWAIIFVIVSIIASAVKA